MTLTEGTNWLLGRICVKPIKIFICKTPILNFCKDSCLESNFDYLFFFSFLFFYFGNEFFSCRKVKRYFLFSIPCKARTKDILSWHVSTYFSTLISVWISPLSVLNTGKIRTPEYLFFLKNGLPNTSNSYFSSSFLHVMLWFQYIIFSINKCFEI